MNCRRIESKIVELKESFESLKGFQMATFYNDDVILPSRRINSPMGAYSQYPQTRPIQGGSWFSDAGKAFGESFGRKKKGVKLAVEPPKSLDSTRSRDEIKMAPDVVQGSGSGMRGRVRPNKTNLKLMTDRTIGEICENAMPPKKKGGAKKMSMKGAGIFGSIWKGLKKGASAAASAVNEVAKQTKVLSTLAGKVPVVGDALSGAIASKGYGKKKAKKRGGARMAAIKL